MIQEQHYPMDIDLIRLADSHLVKLLTDMGVKHEVYQTTDAPYWQVTLDGGGYNGMNTRTQFTFDQYGKYSDHSAIWYPKDK